MDNSEEKNQKVTYIKVKNSAKTLGQIASNFYGNPSEKINLVGITGTNGKTSVTTLLFDIFKNLGFKSALISTVEYRIADEIIPSTHTTPDVIRLNQMLAKAVEVGCEYAFMEVSSHGLALDRVGFTVEDRDRSKGLYYVRYVDPDANLAKGSGWLDKLSFWKSSPPAGSGKPNPFAALAALKRKPE